ncbi:unnamed protein product [Ostreobium quekettii]|uniref:H/ACA ribonucleoprotein complex subunit n=1 Tax=Ostreobium quekettii TaxID=121088 RepID=A0A8S1IV57_9CHLO|nr:unnamed protein product [Ostreobium quekettii]
MSFRGGGFRGGGGGFNRGGRGGRGGSGGRFFRGGGRGGGRDYGSYGPPDSVVEAGNFSHDCEGEAVCKLTNEKIPYFNAPIYLENKAQVGKVEEIFGLINSAYFTIKMNDGIVATSYDEGQKFYIDPYKLLPLERFLPRPKGVTKPGGAGGGRGGGGFRGRGGRFGGRGRGRGGFRGGGRGRGGMRGGFRGRRG